MNFTIGLSELIGFGATLISAGWILLKLSLAQFEKRLDEKFKSLDTAVSDVKRLELEVVRADTRNAQTYIARQEYNDTLKRIFDVLERMEQKLDSKANAFDCDTKILRHMPRP
mgnify:CR=1 FL=1